MLMKPANLEENRTLPEISFISNLLGNISPLKPTKAVERALGKAFPSKRWHVKQAASYWYSAQIDIVQADGALVAPNAEHWFKQQTQLVGPAALIHGIKQEDFRLAKNGGNFFYALGLDVADTLNFVQINFRSRRRLTCSLQNIEPSDLSRNSDNNYSFDWDKAERSEPIYTVEAKDILNSLDLVELCQLTYRARRERDASAMKDRDIVQVFMDGHPAISMPYLEAFPLPQGWCDEPSHEKRWFNDWKNSSAGIHPMGQFWYLQTSDYTPPGDLRNVKFIPLT